jgi:hypothetical protein
VDVGSQIQAQVAERFLIDFGMVWVVIAIMVGLGASELKKRSFWAWTVLSLIAGPIAWYVLFVRLPIYIPKEMQMPCPNCAKTIRKDAKVCRYCNKLVSAETKDRASELGKTAATMVFTARTLLGRARKAADSAAAARDKDKRPPTGG